MQYIVHKSKTKIAIYYVIDHSVGNLDGNNVTRMTLKKNNISKCLEQKLWKRHTLWTSVYIYIWLSTTSFLLMALCFSELFDYEDIWIIIIINGQDWDRVLKYIQLKQNNIKEISKNNNRKTSTVARKKYEIHVENSTSNCICLSIYNQILILLYINFMWYTDNTC